MAKSLMGQVNRKPVEQDEAEDKFTIHPPPKFCQAQGCKEDSTFVMARVASGRGIQHKPASDVMTWERFAGKLKFTMIDGYQFLGWFARCPTCHRAGMARRKAELRAQGEHRFYT